MLMSMLLSQELDYDGDVEEYVATVAKHPRLTHVSFGDFVDLYNGLVDRVKLQNCVRSPLALYALSTLHRMFVCVVFFEILR